MLFAIMFKKAGVNKMALKDNILKARKDKNMTQDEVAKELFVKRQTYGAYERGVSVPDAIVLDKLARLFEVTTDYLLGSDEKTKNVRTKRRTIKMPVYGMVAAGAPILTVEDILDYIEVDEEDINGGDFIALQVKGDSMLPDIKSGDIILVKRQPDVDSGQIAVVIINGDEATVKKVVKQRNGINLVATNTEYEPKFFSNKEINDLPVIVYGRVAELRRRFN